jgi:hypothetical protein
MRKSFAFIAVVLALLAPEHGHGFGVLPGSGLGGLDAVSVQIFVMDDTPVPHAAPELLAAVSSTLSAAGVRVMSGDECGNSATCANTYLRVSGARGATGRAWAYMVELDLLQGVTLNRDPKTNMSADLATFHMAKVGLAASEHVPEAVRASAVSLAQQLGYAFKRENKR